MLAIILFILTSFALAACGGDTGDDPAVVVERYIEAKVASDGDKIRELLCASKEADIDLKMMSFHGIDARVEGMSCSRVGETDTVSCTGTIIAVYGSENREFPLGSYRVTREDGIWRWCGEAG